MASINIKTVRQTSLLHIESSLDRLGLLSPTHDQLSQQQSGQITVQPVLINKSKFLKATHRTKIRKIEIPRSMVVEALSWGSRRASQHLAVQSPVHPWKSPTNLACSPLPLALVERKMTVVRHQLFPNKSPGSRLWFSRTGVQPSPGSSTIELYPPPSPHLVRTHPIEHYQALRDSAPCLSRAATLPKGTKLELGRGAYLETPSSANHTTAASQPTGRIAKADSWLHLSRVSNERPRYAIAWPDELGTNPMAYGSF